MLILLLVLLGLGAGSFINALVWRTHLQSKGETSKELSILSGRSVCPNCRHKLVWYDLVPILSFIWLKGRCRYCKKPIEDSPLTEALMAIVFAGSYAFWPAPLHANGQWLLFCAWLAASVGLLALAVYDLRWMLLPNRIIYPTLIAAAAGRLGWILAYSGDKAHDIWFLVLSLAIASGVFWLLFYFSKGKWIGFGDVRLGLITGTLLADPLKSLAMIFIASVIGTLAVLPDLIRGRKSLKARLPFGPFLIASTAVLVVFGDSLIDWYKQLFVLS